MAVLEANTMIGFGMSVAQGKKNVRNLNIIEINDINYEFEHTFYKKINLSFYIQQVQNMTTTFQGGNQHIDALDFQIYENAKRF